MGTEFCWAKRLIRMLFGERLFQLIAARQKDDKKARAAKLAEEGFTQAEIKVARKRNTFIQEQIFNDCGSDFGPSEEKQLLSALAVEGTSNAAIATSHLESDALLVARGGFGGLMVFGANVTLSRFSPSIPELANVWSLNCVQFPPSQTQYFQEFAHTRDHGRRFVHDRALEEGFGGPHEHTCVASLWLIRQDSRNLWASFQHQPVS